MPRLGEYALSAGRSLIFNALLARRVEQGTWNALLAGDLANLDARGSVFAVDAVDDALRARVAAQDLHPTGPMWGDAPASLQPSGAVQALEHSVIEEFAPVCAGLAHARMAPSRRALRLAVRELRWTFETDDTVRLDFLLRAGGYATTVLRELVEVREPAPNAGSAPPTG
jgi:tRNA pseudouridine13 synthase